MYLKNLVTSFSVRHAVLVLALIGSCAKTKPENAHMVRPVDIKLSTDNITSFSIDQKRLCNDYVLAKYLGSNLVIFEDRSIVQPDERSAFPSKTSVAITSRSCLQNKALGCIYRLQSADAIRVLGSTPDGRSVFILYNNNLIGMLRLDKNFKPIILEGPIKLNQRIADAIPSYSTNYSESFTNEIKNIDEIYDRFFRAFNNKYHLVSYKKTKEDTLYFLSDKNQLKISIYDDKRNVLINSYIHETDIKNLITFYDDDIALAANGFFQKISKNQNYEMKEMPFYTGTDIYNKMIDSSLSNNFECDYKPKRNLNISVIQAGGVYFRKIVNSDSLNSNKLPVVFFHGGPLGSFNADHPGTTATFILNQGRSLIVPSTSASLGAGVTTSSRLRRKFLQAPQIDSAGLDIALDRLAEAEKVDILAYSFGAIFALDFLNRYPDRVRRLALIVPFAKHRDPKLYRKTKRGYEYQRLLEASAIGLTNSDKKDEFQKYLLNLYTNASLHGDKIFLVTGSIDNLTPRSDLPDVFLNSLQGELVVKGDHALVSILPETEAKIRKFLN